MVVIKQISLRCDHCEVVSLPHIGGSQEAKRVLREAGWRFRGGDHRCPQCASTVTSATASEETDEGQADTEQEPF